MKITELKKYQSEALYSYSFGAFVTIELLKNRPNDVFCVLVDESFVKNESYQLLNQLCFEHHIPLFINQKLVEKLRNKDNCFVIGVFYKKINALRNHKHVILENIHDYGVLGTIIRSMHGFNFHDLILLNCDIDFFHPHVVRASMGAFFSVNIEKIDSIKAYKRKYPKQLIFSCHETGKLLLNEVDKNLKNITLWMNPSTNLEQSIKINEQCSLENNANILFFHFYEE